MGPNRVEVIIDGQILTLLSDEEEAYMQKIALHVDKKINEMKVADTNKFFGDNFRVLLASLNITSDYFKALKQYEDLQELQTEYNEHISELQQENKALSEQIRDIQTQISDTKQKHAREMRDMQIKLANTEADLEEYITTFDAIQKEERRNVVNFQDNKQEKKDKKDRQDRTSRREAVGQ
ncbi:MAG: cell division protein ZapA [Defluviitaleaceae bacterium]|nr:cell division protein ZapA [Defluviitaleaceae bacterium]